MSWIDAEAAAVCTPSPSNPWSSHDTSRLFPGGSNDAPPLRQLGTARESLRDGHRRHNLVIGVEGSFVLPVLVPYEAG